MSSQNKYNKPSAISYTEIEGDYFETIFKDWQESDLWIGVFAEERNISAKQALQHIEMGRRIHNHRTTPSK